MTLTRSEKKALKQVFSAVTDPALVKYLDEAKLCVKANACRAAIVLAWCGVIHNLHCQVEHMGLEHFARSYRKKYPSEKMPRIEEVSDLREIKDFHLLKILLMIGILTSEEDYRVLDDFRDLRNRCAHVGPSSVTQHDALEWFVKVERFIVNETGADLKVISPSYVVIRIEDEKFELTPMRIRGMIIRIHTEERLSFVDKLIKLYFAEESTQKHRERIGQVWVELKALDDLDDHVKIMANRKIADRLSNFGPLSELQARHLIFWRYLKQAGDGYSSQIVANLLSELKSAVDGGDITEHDVDILKIMSENSTGPNHEECIRLLTSARKIVYGTENEEALQLIHDQADGLTAQKGA